MRFCCLFNILLFQFEEVPLSVLVIPGPVTSSITFGLSFGLQNLVSHFSRFGKISANISFCNFSAPFFSLLLELILDAYTSSLDHV